MSRTHNRFVYMHGTKGQKYGIWNGKSKCFQFGICEDTPMLADARLAQKIGDDARKWRFEARPLPKEEREKVTGATVKRGHWISHPSGDFGTCGDCWKETDFPAYVGNIGVYNKAFPYCPECGAKMYKEAEDDD